MLKKKKKEKKTPANLLIYFGGKSKIKEKETLFLIRLALQLLKCLKNIIWDIGVREAFLLKYSLGKEGKKMRHWPLYKHNTLKRVKIKLENNF